MSFHALLLFSLAFRRSSAESLDLILTAQGCSRCSYRLPATPSTCSGPRKLLNVRICHILSQSVSLGTAYSAP